MDGFWRREDCPEISVNGFEMAIHRMLALCTKMPWRNSFPKADGKYAADVPQTGLESSVKEKAAATT
ncbi:MAG: hypothetical protein FWF49_06595 [Oscillospiraceae bacterium]|nr:hypothetical protein [Oscillospiraceae bacterium]